MSPPTEKSAKKWVPRPYDPQLIARLSKQTGIPPATIQIMAGRGIVDPGQIILFLAPPSLGKGLYRPERLPGCRPAAELIVKAIQDGKKITIFGDYDVDGMTATAILTGAIQLVGGKVNYYVPNRLEEGYGLNCDTMKKLRDDGTDMIVTVDCGITCFKEAIYAKEIGLDLIVSDHHTPLAARSSETTSAAAGANSTGENNSPVETTVRPVLGEESGNTVDTKSPEIETPLAVPPRFQLPQALAIVHPRIDSPDGDTRPYPCPDLCGAVVALKLAWAIGKAFAGGENVSSSMREFLIGAVGLAALGTVADVVPLRDENRTIVRFALSNSLVTHIPIGLQCLIQAAGLQYRKQITSEDIGFSIAPRLNAAGREVLHHNDQRDEEDERNWLIGKSLLEHPDRLAGAGQMGLASLGVELLITQRQARAEELAPFINNLNSTRQKLERKIMSEALRLIEKDYEDDPAFVLASREWHPGVIGIVAGRLAERFHRPVVMIALQNSDPGTGSARGIPDLGLNLYQALEHCSEYLVRFGGHAAAAGLGINEANIAGFRAAFCDYVAQHVSEEAKTPTLYIDAEFPLSAVSMSCINDMDKMAPFGSGNPRPLFASFQVSLASPAKRIGAKGKIKKDGLEMEEGRTFSARFRQFQDERRAIAFGRGEWVDEMNAAVAKNPGVKFDIVYQIVFNDYLKQPELRLIDWRISQ